MLVTGQTDEVCKLGGTRCTSYTPPSTDSWSDPQVTRLMSELVQPQIQLLTPLSLPQ